MRSTQRLIFLDYARATAIIAMIIYHFVYDLGQFGFVDMFSVINGPWKTFAQLIGISFLFISGFSFWIMARNGINWSKYFRRLGVLIFAALAVSLGTLYYMREAFIFFGILHLLATCSILAVLIYKIPSIALIFLGIILILIPQYFKSEIFEPKILAWTGLYDGLTGSADFYAFMPWSAAFIFGISLAKIGNSKFKSDSVSQSLFREKKLSRISTFLLWAGKNSLLVYIVHQPILIGLIYCYTLI